MSQDMPNFADDFNVPSQDDWMALVEKTLRGKPFEKAMRSQTEDGIVLNALETKATAILGQQPPGRDGEWEVVSTHRSSNAKQVNAELLEDLLKGASGLALVVGDGGIDATDLATALDGVYLDMLPFTLLPGEDFEATVNSMDHLLRERGYSADVVNGCLGIDPLGTLARTGRLQTEAGVALAGAGAIAADWAERYPGVTTFAANGTPYSNAGATDAQELGAVLATGVAYLRAMEEAGLPLETAADQIQFVHAADASLWTTIAKFRAFRRAWQQILAACGIGEARTKVMGVSAVRMFTLRDPWVNILRGTAACFAAVAGGADSVAVLPHDVFAGQSTEFSRRVARNIQIVLQEESNLARVSDPAAGSYALESLTSMMTSKSLEAFKDLESKGGLLANLRDGSFSADIAATAQRREQAIRTRKRPITGVSEFPNIHEEPLELVASAPLPQPVAAAAGEIITPLTFRPLAASFELLRARTAMMQETPKIALVNLGTPADFTARATFAKNFFEAGGIEAVPGTGASDVAELVQYYEEAGAKLAVICGTDEQYGAFAAAVAQALKRAGCQRLYLAGKPANLEALLAAGVDEAIHLGCDVVASLDGAYATLGWPGEGDAK